MRSLSVELKPRSAPRAVIERDLFPPALKISSNMSLATHKTAPSCIVTPLIIGTLDLHEHALQSDILPVKLSGYKLLKGVEREDRVGRVVILHRPDLGAKFRVDKSLRDKILEAIKGILGF